MKRKLFITDDGSHSLYVPELDENYHSTHGAIQESQHVFIESGLNNSKKDQLTILEIGFGTGLNALLTLIACRKTKQHVKYIGIEKYPLTPEEYASLNYSSLLTESDNEGLLTLHNCNWETEQTISPQFALQKLKIDANAIQWNLLPNFDIIYFDAFAPNKQSELWNQQLFKKIFDHSNPSAIFVTYCAKGIVRRDLQAAGFIVERIPGPPGKKEMLRAFKYP